MERTDTPHPAAEGGGERLSSAEEAATALAATIRELHAAFHDGTTDSMEFSDLLDGALNQASAFPAHPAPAAPGEDAARLEAALPDLIGCCAKCGRRLTVILNVEHANPHYRIETLCQCGAELHLWRRAARAQEGR